MRTLIAILIMGALIGLNVVLMKKNKATPVPEGCENLKPDCKGCGIASCEIRSEIEAKEGEK